MTRVAAPSAASQPERLAVAFARVLRRSGLAVPPDASVAYAQALSAVGLLRRGPVYWAGRATLVRRPEDSAAYDRAFAAFWLGESTTRLALEVDPEPLTLVVDVAKEEIDLAESEEDEEAEDERRQVHLRYSGAEVLRTKDFAACTSWELAEAQRLMASLRFAGTRRRTRRLQPARSRGQRPDLRRTVRHALRAGGEPVRRAWLEQGDRPRRVVLLCDVSGSMEPYARALVRFLHVAVTGRGRVEAFTIGTRLTRLTRELSLHDPDVAMTRAARAVPDWSSGTRLGEALREFNDRWGYAGPCQGRSRRGPLRRLGPR